MHVRKGFFDMNLILASASPRRRELITQVGVSFVIEVSDVEEVLDDTLSLELQVQSLALQKAQVVAAQHKDGLVLGADTVVVDAGSLLGKPQNTEEAAEMLRSLSGKWHQVMTAVALVDANDTKHEWTSVEITNVKFRDLTEDDIAAYVATGESMDKAGAYGIQGYGALLVERIEGCYNNVVGLPLQLVAKGLRNWGINLYEYKEVQTQ